MGDTIIGVQFGIANPDDIVNRSVAEIITEKTYQSGQPVPGGVFDARLGVIEAGKICPTCKQTHTLCPGHFGHIRLARPVYLYQFIDFIQKILGVVCLACSNPYLPDADLEQIAQKAKGIERFDIIRADSKTYKDSALKETKACPHCGSPAIDKITKRDGTVAKLEATTYDKEAEPILLEPEMVLRCFQRMTDDHVRALGFNPKFSRPDWMICTVLAVPPLTVRPSVVMDDNQRMEDDLTHKLIEIVRDNQRLRTQIDKGENATVISQLSDMLQFHIATYVDNDIKGLPPAAQRSGRPLKTLKSRLGAKHGRVRGNLMGKRVDFSARSVITPDSNIEVDELGVPEEIAMNLTFPEAVTAYNRDRLMSYIRNGRTKYPGAKSVYIRESNQTYTLNYIKPERLDLKEGDIVHRHLIDGDVVLFNRQPSLHKLSMLCHRVKVLPGSTFRLNVSATKPYNADFDGDEMNMHVPQSITSATELKVIASLLRQIISPRKVNPIIALYQDTMTGTFRMSKAKSPIPEHLAMNMLARTKKPLANFKRTGMAMTGPQILSEAFPMINTANLTNGMITKAPLNSGAFTGASKGILHVVYNEMGPERAADMINAIQAIITKYNLHTGFSTGPSDLVLNKETEDFMNEKFKQGREQVSEILTSVHAGTFLNETGRSNGDELELKIMQTLQNIGTPIGDKAIESLSQDNRMIEMVNSGSKGSNLNVQQMMALLGQQNVDGKRIQFMMDNRTLPHYSKFDDGLESRGFIENSFISGLRPTEFFFHAMAGREGLIDTAVKTSQTGYIQRRLVKLMEDLHVEYDGTVRDSTGTITQFYYGEDGIDAISVENQECALPRMTLEAVYSNFAASKADFAAVMAEEPSEESPDFLDQILKDREMLVKHVLRYNNGIDFKAPVHLERTIAKYKNPYSTKSDLTPEYVVEELNKLCNEPLFAPNRLFHVLLRFHLAPKKSILVLRLTRTLFDELLREIRYKYIKAQVHAGEMVGALAAQSIGEPTTQLTLNTFHSAGTVKANATQGVPRIEELLQATRNLKSPLNYLYPVHDIAVSKDRVIQMKMEIQKTMLRDITKSVRIYYDPSPQSTNTLVQEDREILAMYERFSVTKANECVSPWVMRLELDPLQMASRNLTDMSIIQARIQNNKTLRIFECIHSDSNSSKLILRITFGADIAKNVLSLRFLEDKLLDTVLTGVEGIGRAIPREVLGELVYNPKTGGYEGLKQHVLDVEGTNLYELLVLPNVDATRTFSNDIHEIHEIFGIEAARICLLEELSDAFKAEPINYHHMSVLVDTMTCQGKFVQITRVGMSKQDSGVLARSSFEMTARVLFDAAVEGEFDSMRGVSANIMFGQKPPCGTGFVDILVDETKLPEGVEEEVSEGDLAHANTIINQEMAKDETNGVCRMEDILMAW